MGDRARAWWWALAASQGRHCEDTTECRMQPQHGKSGAHRRPRVVPASIASASSSSMPGPWWWCWLWGRVVLPPLPTALLQDMPARWSALAPGAEERAGRWHSMHGSIGMGKAALAAVALALRNSQKDGAKWDACLKKERGKNARGLAVAGTVSWATFSDVRCFPYLNHKTRARASKEPTARTRQCAS